MKSEIRYLSLCGLLGYGYAPESLARALQEPLDFIGVDGGSTDPGPYYLGSGKGFVKHLQIKRDLSLVLKTALERKIVLIIGSAGGSGARPHVESTLEILREIAAEQKLRFRTAVIYSDLSTELLQKAVAEKRLSPCGGAAEFRVDDLPRLCHPVAQFGTDPIMRLKAVRCHFLGRCCELPFLPHIRFCTGSRPGWRYMPPRSPNAVRSAPVRLVPMILCW